MLEERELGSRDVRVTRVGLGLAALGRPAYITLGRDHDLGAERSPEMMYARTAAVLDAARHAGIRYVDVARSYGRAEEFLARWIAEREIAVDAISIGSKWGYRYTADWTLDAETHEHKELSLDRFRVQVGETAAWLGSALDLYQIHSATIESGCLDDAALLRALVEGRRAGRYRAVGLTLSGPRSADTLAAALGATAHGERVFDVVQATFNLLEPSLAEPLARAHEAGVGVLVKEAFANGRLTPANDRGDDAARLGRLRKVAADRGLTLDQLAVAFVLAHRFVDVLVSGAATPAQLASHVASAAHPLDGATLARLAEEAQPPTAYWQTRAHLPWR